MSCHDGAPAAPAAPSAPGRGAAGPGAPAPAAVVLVGNPNVGKSSLFNALTGARARVTNAPGTTVELEVGTWRGARVPVRPPAMSGEPAPVAQVPAGAHPARRGGSGPARGAGAPERRAPDAARAVRVVDLPGTYSLVARSPDEQVTADAVAAGRAGGARRVGGAGRAAVDGPAACDLAVVLLDAGALSRSLYLLGQVVALGCPVVVALTLADVARTRGVDVDAERLAAELGVPVVEVDARAGTGVDVLTEAVLGALAEPGAPPSGAVASVPVVADLEALDDAAALFGWVAGVVARVPGAAGAGRAGPTWSDRVDRVLLDRWLGVPALLAVLWALFELTTRVAGPLVTATGAFVTGPVSGAARTVLPGPAWLEGLLVDGVLAGAGTVVSFAPLMGLMFLAIALLEDCGYLARAAFVADRAMRTLGLDGRAVLPLVVGFGCNVPALAATRALPSERQRRLTALLVPLTSCSARLTVHVLLASVFFPAHAGVVVLALYVLSVVLVVLGGLALRATAFRDLRREPLVLVLPAYQRPRVRALLTSAGVRVRTFVLRAGRVVVVTLTVVWVLVAVPAVPGAAGAAWGEVPVEDSLYGAAAHALAPLLAPAGADDWHVVAALATGVVAKEVVVGSFAQSYALEAPAGPADGSAAARDLGAALNATFDRSSDGHPRAAAAGFLVLVLTYTPCVATIAEQRRLLGARATLAAVGVQLLVAWSLAVLVFQVGRLL